MIGSNVGFCEDATDISVTHSVVDYLLAARQRMQRRIYFVASKRDLKVVL
jgi:hypothetical protein